MVFDTLINDQDLSLVYNPVTGVFTITRVGNYLVSWQVAIDGSDLGPTASFTLVATGPVSNSITSSIPVITGQISGSALVTVAGPTTLSLVNTSGFSIFFADLPVQANIVITDVSF